MLHIPFSERAHVKISYYIKQLKQGFVKGLGSAQTPPPYPRRPDRSRLHRPHTTKCCVGYSNFIIAAAAVMVMACYGAARAASRARAFCCRRCRRPNCPSSYISPLWSVKMSHAVEITWMVHAV